MYYLPTFKPRAVYKNLRYYEPKKSIIIKWKGQSNGNKGWDGDWKDESGIIRTENRAKGGYCLMNSISLNFLETKVKRELVLHNYLTKETYKINN